MAKQGEPEETVPEEAVPQETVPQKLRRAYSAAGTRLREAHRDEFNTYQAEEAEKLGIEWTPRPTGLDKARAELEALLNANPKLVDEFARRIAERQGE